MIVQDYPNGWSCFPTALAILLNIPVSEIIKDIGHDGSEIIFPEPNNRRGFCYRDLVIYCLKNDLSIMEVELEAALGDRTSKSLFYLPKLEVPDVPCIVTGITTYGWWHAAAWNGNGFVDKLMSNPLMDMEPDAFYIVK
jgi:hypothetical protein